MTTSELEKYSFEYLMQQCLADVPSNIDKRQGSIIYDALAPACYRLAEFYIHLKYIFENTFIGTATDDYLDRIVADLGITRNTATASVALCEFKNSNGNLMDIAIGSRFSTGSNIFTAVEKVSLGIYKLQSETMGEVGNVYIGSLISLTFIDGLDSIELTEILIPGEDIESDDSLRSRYFSLLTDRNQDGNLSQYKKWAEDFSGVGKAKIFPLWAGDNTVKVSAISVEGTPISDESKTALQNYLDPGINGLGNGVAPIGSIVTVSTASTLAINIAADITLSAGYTEPEGVQTALEEYLLNIAYETDSINYLKLAAIIIDQPSISNIENLLVNGGTANIDLTAEQVAILGTLTLEEVGNV